MATAIFDPTYTREFTPCSENTPSKSTPAFIWDNRGSVCSVASSALKILREVKDLTPKELQAVNGVLSGIGLFQLSVNLVQSSISIGQKNIEVIKDPAKLQELFSFDLSKLAKKENWFYSLENIDWATDLAVTLNSREWISISSELCPVLELVGYSASLAMTASKITDLLFGRENAESLTFEEQKRLGVEVFIGVTKLTIVTLAIVAISNSTPAIVCALGGLKILSGVTSLTQNALCEYS